MDAAADQWHQELGLVKPMEMVSFSTATITTTGISTTTSASNTCTTTTARPQVTEKRSRPQKEQALNCPRCSSTNTKFCYYNNYSLTQPRYLCKTCRRYWTEGGSLRNVPVGGGSRKNKRLSLSSATTPVTPTAVSNSKNTPPITELNPPPISFSTPHHDLNLAFPHPGLPEFSEFANLENNSNGASARWIRAFAPLSLPEFPAGFELQELRAPALDFPMEGSSSGQYARVLFPFEDMKPAAVHASANEADFDISGGQSGHPPAALWNGMIGSGGTW